MNLTKGSNVRPTGDKSGFDPAASSNSLLEEVDHEIFSMVTIHSADSRRAVVYGELFYIGYKISDIGYIW